MTRDPAARHSPAQSFPIHSILWRLVVDETAGHILASGDWLSKWVCDERDRASPAFAEALGAALPALAQFRRALRNFALGRPLEERVICESSNCDPHDDAAVRENILRCYIYILCRIAARRPDWASAYQRFLDDSLVLFAISEPGPRGACSPGERSKEVLIQALDEVNCWLTGAYSLYGISVAWPRISEMSLGILVGRPGNLRSTTVAGQARDMKEHLLPTLAALKRYGSVRQPVRTDVLYQQHLAGAKDGSEFRRLVIETTRASDARRQAFMRLYCMALERILWLDETARGGPDTRHSSDAVPGGFGLLGRQLDHVIETGSLTPAGQFAGRMAGWVTKDLEHAASAAFRRPPPRKSPPLARMAIPSAMSALQPASHLTVDIADARDDSKGLTLSLRFPEHQLPQSGRWYEVEFAAKAANGHLVRLPVAASEAQTSMNKGQRCASFEIFLSRKNRYLLPIEPGRLVCGAALQLTRDQQGANILIVLGKSPEPSD